MAIGLLAWQLWNSDSESVPAHPTVSSLSDKPTIAVVPFTNQSGSSEQEYFSDGLTEDIITYLSRIPSLRVIARQSSFAYKGEVIDLQKIGQELRARYILHGSVRRNEDRIRAFRKF